jgi:hypothetical protein
MKTNLFYKSIMAIAIILFLNQFSAYGQWSIANPTGTYISPSDYNVLGTDGTTLFGQQAVRFFSGGTEYMRLTNSGQFGIGTTTPTAGCVLDVYGGPPYPLSCA